ncbi:hypothetical protein LOD99_11286 [Oopsacas minuta]|uniref:Uncharacterized protein n=1 Tax=Oopsacas minuta TaxID=111878 RepID=A0AAV7K7I2_9METZ|nr:hypothetical protein LOD99_11286 [Oopsacas minuta]
MAEPTDFETLSPVTKRKMVWEEINIITALEEARELIETLKFMARRVMKADCELYYCNFSRTTHPDCSIKAKIEKYGSEYKVCLFGHHKHDECNQKVELRNKGLSYEKKQLCLEILKSSPYTLPRKIFDIMVNQRPDLTFVPEDIIKIRHFKYKTNLVYLVYMWKTLVKRCATKSLNTKIIHKYLFVKNRKKYIMTKGNFS